ncbi:NfeD family protein, partial [Chloroflexota bacterium]
LWLVIVVAICIIAFIVFAINRGIQAHRHQIAAGREDLVGKIAEVKTALEPKGIVLVQGELWTAMSETGWMKPEEEVIITKVDGLKLYVTKKE